MQGAVPAPLSNLERWDTAGFEVVGSKKKKRSPKVQASSPGENVSVSRRGGLSMSESTSNSSEVEIDPRHFGLIIGEKGATLMKLQVFSPSSFMIQLQGVHNLLHFRLTTEFK